ncbi:uncharacterized protein [Physcomitrium patens]|uniref:mitogen-activated protein kinase kinase kinase n=3 Tax=Physcomitrium patens TaxID=3218 RepID=A0A2K1L7U7_PHYPA|nr:mitogen-activated protein kinase kinase kinase 3-like isoform X2 [Physcomitrium patens]PNR62082.1 hypothetical protein PHYPA_000506 [Physcomitrium patens]|eukprot:XP_024374811.1 mitogen-activated protein kinase kinase kinase 3-like isoform X2 [Physcomitrella patens]
MKLLEIFKKKKKTAVGNGEPHDASPPTPTPTPLSKPPPDHSICKRPESYFLALALPPLHTSSLPKYPTRRIESQLTKIQPPVDKAPSANGREQVKIAASYLKSQKRSMWVWPCLQLDSDASEPSSPTSPRRDSNSTRNHSLSSQDRRDSSNALDPSSAGGSGRRHSIRPQSECITVDYGNPGYNLIANNPAEGSAYSTPQRNPRERSRSGHGKPSTPRHQGCRKPCKLPSPPNLTELDRKMRQCATAPATPLQKLSPRPRAPPVLMFNQETVPQGHKLTPPASPRPHKLTPPPSPYHATSSAMNLERLDVPKPPQRWKMGQLIGSGSFGSVYEGWNLDDGSFFAVKVSSIDNVSSEIHQEVAMLSKLKHPNIVQYYGTTTEDGNICIFLELVKMGSLEKIMKKFDAFDEVLIRLYTRQILKGLEYLHSRNTVHRDIKCANILVDSDGQVKLADFGLAKQMKESMASSVKGSPYYMAPEILAPQHSKRPYGLPVDIWSLGCTVIEMADGKPPWGAFQGYGFVFNVVKGVLPPIPEHLSDKAKDFISQCLRKRPEDRPTVKELLLHPFVAITSRTF